MQVKVVFIYDLIEGIAEDLPSQIIDDIGEDIHAAGHDIEEALEDYQYATQGDMKYTVEVAL